MIFQWVVAVLFMIFLYGFYEDTKRIRIKQKRIDHRESLSLEKIYPDNYEILSLNRDKFIHHWTSIAKILRFDPEKLRPADRFDKELAPVSKDSVSDELEDLEEFLVDEIENNNYEIDLKELNTLDDVIKAFCKK